MCGIIAAVYVQSSQKNRALSLSSLQNRGPDATGEWSSPAAPVWLGHRRLAIVDLSAAGHQPMPNEDKSIWLVCNGEIYNYPTLRTHLEGKGHTFYSNSDSEVILHAYEAWGADCINRLAGMFAFILWDDKRQRLLAARDRVGIKPLYYTNTGQGLLLASEAGALLSLLPTRPEPEPTALAYVMSLGYVPAPWSIWQGIYKLEPGHLLSWQPHRGQQDRRYWQPPQYIDQTPANVEEWSTRFETVLNEHLLSDVPIGLFLSGGLDSSAVAAGLHQIERPVEAITISFPGSRYDEAPIAAAVSRRLGLSHQVVPLLATNVEELITQVSATYDEPQSYSALLSMYLVSRVAAHRFKVVLAGDGGDEIFGGYTWYKNLDNSFRWPSLSPRGVARALRSFFYKPLPGEREFTQKSPLHRHAWRLHPRFLPAEAEAILAPTGLRFGQSDMLAPLEKHFVPTLPLKRALQRVDLMTFCSDSILAKVDRASMSHSLEVRVPLLDHRLIEWALIRPPTPREESESKPVLRDYLRPQVPAPVLNHPKQGFSLRVLDDYNWDAALEVIRHGFWVRSGYWSADWERLLAQNVTYRSSRIWNLLTLTHWAKAWLE